MIEVYRNSSEFITHTVYFSGMPTDVDNDAITVVLKNPATNEVFTTSDIIPLNLGRYQVRIPTAATENDGPLKATWNYTVEGVAMKREQDIEVVTPYVSLDEITYAYPELYNKSYEELREMERRVRLIIDKITGQSFGTSQNSVIIGGEGTYAMPQRLTQVHYFAYGGVRVNPLDYRILNDGWMIQVTFPPGYYQVKSDTFLAPGHRNMSVALIGTFGWSTVPNDINMAAKMLIGDYFCNDSIYRQKGIKAIRAADWRIEYHDAAFAGTGNLDVDMLLNKYAAYNMVII